MLLTGYAESGITTGKFVRRRASDGAWWSVNPPPSGAFEAYSAANIALYGLTATEVGSTGVYIAADPAAGVEGDYLFVKAAGSSLAVGDLTTGGRWQGEAGGTAAVWGNGTRTLTAGTNIVLEKGTGVTGFNDLDAAGVRNAVGLASANLDTQLLALASSLSTITSAVAAVPAAAATAVWASVLVSTRTAGWLLRKVAAMLLGRCSGANTGTEQFADVDEADPDDNPSVTVTVDDDGNRSDAEYSA